jgi:hypothetical protein
LVACGKTISSGFGGLAEAVIRDSDKITDVDNCISRSERLLVIRQKHHTITCVKNALYGYTKTKPKSRATDIIVEGQPAVNIKYSLM